MAKTWVHPSSQSSRWAANPAENMTRVSMRWSAATEQADPIAIPTSIVFSAQGTPSSLSAHRANPQWPQSKPCGCCRVPIKTIHSACRMLSASRKKNLKPFSSYICLRVSERMWILLSVTSATSMTSIPFPLGAVLAAIIICWAICSTASWRQSRSFSIIV